MVAELLSPSREKITWVVQMLVIRLAWEELNTRQ